MEISLKLHLSKALEFYKLVCTQALDVNGRPDPNSYHGHMIG